MSRQIQSGNSMKIYLHCVQYSYDKIQIHFNTAHLNRNIHYFNPINYHLFNVNYTSFDKIAA